MSFQKMNSVTIPVAAAAVITAKHGVYIDSNGQALEITDGDTQQCVGVALESRVADTASVEDALEVPVAIFDSGIFEIEAGEAMTAGDRIYVGNDGRAYSGTGAGAENPAGTYSQIGTLLSGGGAAGAAATFIGLVDGGSTTTS